MFSLKPGTAAIIIGARTVAGRANIGKNVELFALINPGERCLNPVNGVMTEVSADAPRALWLVTGDVSAGEGQYGFAYVRAEYLLPLTPDALPAQERTVQVE